MGYADTQMRRTPDGHDPKEVISALQKDIRRGNVVEALYWSMELLGGGYHKWLWRRLEVISHEDIGVFDLQVPMFVETCRRQFFTYYNLGSEMFDLALINAVVAMCRAKKTRLADDLFGYVVGQPALRFEIPDYALDMHTARGRAAGRGEQHFYDEAGVVRPEVEWEPGMKELAEFVHEAVKEQCVNGPGTTNRSWYAGIVQKMKDGAAKPAHQPSLFSGTDF